MNKCAVVIVASRIRLGEDYRRARSEIDPDFHKRARVLTHIHHLYGLKDAELHCVGNWREHPEWLLITELARQRGLTFKEIPDWHPESELHKWL